MPEPVLSVVLPNFNHARVLPKALAALTAQSRQTSEIIVVDDGSTDDSVAVVEEFAATHPNLKLLRNAKNEGVIAALSRGLAAAQGQHVYFAASDDWVLPGFFEFALAMLAKYPGAGFFCGETVLLDGVSGAHIGTRPAVRPSHRPASFTAAETARLLRSIDNWISTGSSVFRRDAVLAAGGFDEALGSFADGFLARKIALTHGFCYAPRRVAVWRVYPDSVSRQTAKELQKMQDFLRIVIPRLERDPAFPPWYPRLFDQRWRFATSRLALEKAPVDRDVLTAMSCTSKLDRHIVGLLSGSGKSRWLRILGLAWLWQKFRPYPLTGLMRTALARRRESIPI